MLITNGRAIIGQLAVLADPRAFWALATWPKFSVTSFKMVSSLIRQHILVNTVIDVGANVGQFAVAAAKLFPSAQVYSFEPLPECVAALERNVRSLGNVSVYPVALGEREGEDVFHVNSYTLSSSFLPLAEGHRSAFPTAVEVKVIRARVRTLDSVFEGRVLTPPVLLKLDVQGYEGTMLRGSVKTLGRVDYVVMEASLKPMYEGELLFTELLNLMDSHGFRFLRPVGCLTHPRTGEVLQVDGLFERK